MTAYRILSRHTFGDKHPEIACIPSAIDIEPFPCGRDAPTKEELTEIIGSHYFDEPEALVPLIAYNVAKDLRRLYPAGPEAESARLSRQAGSDAGN